MSAIVIRISDHIYLREVAVSDAKTIFNAIDAYRDDLRVWLPFVDHLKNVEDEEAFITSTLAVPYAQRNIVFVIECDKIFCGLIGFVNTDTLNHKTEIGYWILPPFRGKGIVTECVKQLCQWTFMHRDMNRIQIKCAVRNYPSNAVPIRLDFKKEGVERDGELLASGKYTDLNIYSILKTELL